MGRQVAGGSLASRILVLLGERYPVTLREVALALAAREDTVRREVSKLRAQGLVVVEDLDGKAYVALTGAGFTHIGLPAKEVQRLRSRRPPPPSDESTPDRSIRRGADEPARGKRPARRAPAPRDESDPAFG